MFQHPLLHGLVHLQLPLLLFTAGDRCHHLLFNGKPNRQRELVAKKAKVTVGGWGLEHVHVV